MGSKLFFLVVFFLVVSIGLVCGSTYNSWVQPDYCAGGVCAGDLLVLGNFSVLGDYVNITVLNYNMTGDSVFNGNLTVNGDSLFNGSFETDCLHCEDGDVVFHGDGFFVGNVTAPNIEVMESLIVHGNSSCTGTASACNTLGNAALCGYTTWTGQIGCTWFFGNCYGTATSCEDVGTALCEEQHVCTLTTGTTGFILGSDGLVGDFDINTSGSITAGSLNITGSITGGASGSDGEVQFNDNGDFGSSNNLTWNNTNNYLKVIGDVNITDLGLSESDYVIVEEGGLLLKRSLNNSIDLRLASTTYNASGISLENGTLDSGNLLSTQIFKDGNSYNVSELNNLDFDIFVNYSNVTNFNTMILNAWYAASDNKMHHVEVCLWEWDDSEWECEYIPDIDYSDRFLVYKYFVFDGESHIGIGGNLGEVHMLLKHDDAGDRGRNTHDFYLDYAVLVDGYSAMTTTAVSTLQQVVDAGNSLDSNIISTANMTINNINVTGDIFVSKLIICDNGTATIMTRNRTRALLRGCTL